MIDEKKLINDVSNYFMKRLAKLSLFRITRKRVEQIVKTSNDIIDIIQQQPKTDWIPCEVKNIIDTIISHNEIVALWVEEPTEDVRYDKQIWRGMAWDIPKVYKECKFIKIFGTVPESIVEADTINIRIELNEEAKLSMHRKETREPITPAYAYKKEGAD